MELDMETIDYIMDQKQWGEDIQQDLFEQLLLADERDDMPSHGELHVRAWNIQRNIRFKESNRARIRRENESEIANTLHSGEQLSTRDPADILSEAYDTGTILKEVLSPQLFSTIKRYVFEGKSIEDIAAEDGVNENTVYQRTSRALKLLEENINE
jgi:DNA-directed RNA polymerase specialized sigma24 family protein